jgi:hypothetical protein
MHLRDKKTRNLVLSHVNDSAKVKDYGLRFFDFVTDGFIPSAALFEHPGQVWNIKIHIGINENLFF